jgi:hypothetical protein
LGAKKEKKVILAVNKIDNEIRQMDANVLRQNYFFFLKRLLLENMELY